MSASPPKAGDLWALSRRVKAPQVLVIDDFVPGTRADVRMPRAAELVRALAAAGAQITVLPTRGNDRADTQGYPALRLKAGDDLGRVLATRVGGFAAIFVARARNMALLTDLMAHNRPALGEALIVYDAELPPMHGETPVADEIANASHADVVLAFEAQTAAIYRRAGHPDVRVLGHAAAPHPAPPFSRRCGILAVGPTYGDPAAIGSAVAWFVEHVLPILRAQLGRSATLTIAGEAAAIPTVRRSDRAVIALAPGADLAAAFDKARVLVVPREAGAGLPLNVYEAARHGVPAVLTPAQARRVGWTHGREILVAESAAEFAAACATLCGNQLLWEGFRANARWRLARECDPVRFDASVAEVLALAVAPERRGGGYAGAR